MAKMYTPAMAKVDARRTKMAKRAGKKEIKADSPGREAWKRLKRNKTALFGMALIALLLICAIFAEAIAPYDFITNDYSSIKLPPSKEHLFGTDNLGRDIFSRCIYGARYTILISAFCVVCNACVGGMLGTLAGYLGGKADNLIMRIMDVFQAIPSVLMAICVVAVLGNGIPQLVTAITISGMSGAARNFRAAILTVKSGEYVEASRAINIGNRDMIIRHLIPNALGVLTIFVVNMLAGGIFIISSLSYIGVGISPPAPEWGCILSQNKAYLMTYPYMVLYPAGCIMIAIFGFNLFGNGLRDALDPRLK